MYQFSEALVLPLVIFSPTYCVQIILLIIIHIYLYDKRDIMLLSTVVYIIKTGRIMGIIKNIFFTISFIKIIFIHLLYYTSVYKNWQIIIEFLPLTSLYNFGSNPLLNFFFRKYTCKNTRYANRQVFYKSAIF